MKKNNAIKPSIIQVEQAEPLLLAIDNALSSLHYSQIVPQRISQQNNNDINHNTTSYQGLTQAQHVRFNKVMIKWQLCLNNQQGLTTLNHEIAVLNALEKTQRNQSNPMVLAPPLLDYKTISLKLLQQTQRLTLLVMPYYFGNSLAHRLKQTLTNNQKHQCIVQVAHLIADLHKSGWLHNDIKLSNILLDNFAPNHLDNSVNGADSNKVNKNKPRPSLLVTDFALATQFNEGFDKNQTANIAGTPAYLAPERWQGGRVTPQSDIYAFGIMMYEIVTGERPFRVSKQAGNSMTDWAMQHCQQPIPTLSNQYSHYQLIVNKTLAKRCENRYKTMEELLEALEPNDRLLS